MSGRGRFNRSSRNGRGRGQYRRKYNENSNNKSRSSEKSEMKFVPHYSGKHQSNTYDVVKEHIILHIQKNFKHGEDIAKCLREEKFEAPVAKPARQIVALPTGDISASDQFRMKMKQDGYDLEYTNEMTKYEQCISTYEANKQKAFTLILDYCNKTMKSRITVMADYETRILNDPIILLKEIKKKMYDPARAKYEYISLTECVSRMIETRQDEKEALKDYIDRFKQNRDIFKSTLGPEILDNFVTSTKEYCDETDNDVKEEIKKSAFEQWMTYLFVKNSDQRKYGSLLKLFSTNYSMGKTGIDTFPKTLTKAIDILINHQWDESYNKAMKND